MRWSNTFIPTLKEDPQEAEAVSHKLMIRAGLIRRLTAGAYTYLPAGLRVLEKTQRIIREEMDRRGALEILMPALQPAELWKKTGRYELMGDVMIKFKDRHAREMALGPTHEEVVTDLVAKEVRSYKDLPLILYQIQTKFRDEVRPRFGVIRSCEFIMKDAYSFDASAEKMEESYKKMYDAYCAIFNRCGLSFLAVDADPGFMGGGLSHEFMVPSEVGEDIVAVCSSCRYAASTDIAAVRCVPLGTVPGTVPKGTPCVDGPAREVKTPGKTTVDQISALLNVKPENIIKTLIYVADGKPVAVLIRGDHEASEPKIKRNLGAASLVLADEKTILKVTGGPLGFSGPVGLDIPLYADHSIRGVTNFVTGANKKDLHLAGVSEGRDFKVSEWMDARVITHGDPCPKCGGKIEIKNAIEIGHTFKLGTKYTEALGAKFLDENGKERPVVMGCYGIGVNRILAASIETNNDKDGIMWPASIAPYEVVIIPANKDDEVINTEAERCYENLAKAGLDVILDDRLNKTSGVKFKDADLVGFPVRVVVGRKGLDKGQIEVKARHKKEPVFVKKEKIAEAVRKMLG